MNELDSSELLQGLGSLLALPEQLALPELLYDSEQSGLCLGF